MQLNHNYLSFVMLPVRLASLLHPINSSLCRDCQDYVKRLGWEDPLGFGHQLTQPPWLLSSVTCHLSKKVMKQLLPFGRLQPKIDTCPCTLCYLGSTSGSWWHILLLRGHFGELSLAFEHYNLYTFPLSPTATSGLSKKQNSLFSLFIFNFFFFSFVSL